MREYTFFVLTTFRSAITIFKDNSDHCLKTTRTTFLGQLGPIVMAIHPVPLNQEVVRVVELKVKRIYGVLVLQTTMISVKMKDAKK
jgi:hypothetical protein